MKKGRKKGWTRARGEIVTFTVNALVVRPRQDPIPTARMDRAMLPEDRLPSRTFTRGQNGRHYRNDCIDFGLIET